MSAASRVGSINVVLNTTFGTAVSGLNTFATHVEKTGVRTQRSVQGIDRSVLGMNRTLAGMRGNTEVFRSLSIGALRTKDGIGQLNGALLATSALFGGLIPTLSGAYLVRMADRAMLAANNLRTVTNSAEELKQVETELFQLSQRTRSSFEGNVTVYSRLARATEVFGTSQRDLLRMTETISKSFAAGGANPAEAKGAAIQLTQGIASDRFSGDEYRSVAENAPVLLNAIADNLGVTIGKLREMAHAGELTARVVTEAILRSSSQIDEAFDKTVSTIGQAVTKLDNAILNYVSNSENASVASATFVTIINAVASNLDTVTDSLLILGGTLAATFAGRRVAELIAYNQAVKAHLLTQKQATAATLERARAEVAVAAFEAKASATALVAAKRGQVSQKTMNELRMKSIANTNAHVTAMQRLTSATLAHEKALQAASISGRSFAAVGRLASASWAFIGGPVGAGMLAIGAAMYVVQRNAQIAEERASRYASAIEQAGEKSDVSSDKIREAAAALEDVAKFASMATLQNEINQTKDDLKSFQQAYTQMSKIDQLFDDRTIRQAVELGVAHKNGEISLREYLDQTDRLALDRGDEAITNKIVGFQKMAMRADAANGRIGALEGRLHGLDGTEVDVNINLNTYNAITKEKIQGALDERRKEAAEQTVEDLQEMAKKGEEIDAVTYRMFSDVLEGIEPKKKRKSEAERKLERFQNALNRLDYQRASAGMSEIDRSTIEVARSAGIADEKIRQFIASIEGNGQAPEQILQLKNRLQELADIEFERNLSELSESKVLVFLSDVDRETVSVARAFGVAEEEVSSFIRAASTGNFAGVSDQIIRIRDELTALSENESLRNAVDGIADAYGSFVKDAITGTESFGDAVRNLVSRLADVYLELLVIEPLMRSLRGGSGGGGITGLLTGGLFGGFGSSGDAWGGLRVATQHTGGQAGQSSRSRVVSAADVAGASVFHTGKSGVKHNEVMALLEKSESVYTADQNGRIAGALERSMSGKTTGGQSTVKIVLDPDLIATILDQAQGQSVEIVDGKLSHYNRHVLPKEAVKAVQKKVASGGRIS